MKSYDELLAERDALSAKLEKIVEVWESMGGWPCDGLDVRELGDAINATPQQCLAEIKAEAAEVAYYNGFKDALVIDKPLSPVADSSATIDMFAHRIEQISRYAANQYAAKVRQGGE